MLHHDYCERGGENKAMVQKSGKYLYNETG
jgi:fucose permease